MSWWRDERYMMTLNRLVSQGVIKFKTPVRERNPTSSKREIWSFGNDLREGEGKKGGGIVSDDTKWGSGKQGSGSPTIEKSRNLRNREKWTEKLATLKPILELPREEETETGTEVRG